MTNLEIYEQATNVLTMITADLNDSIYKNMNGELTLLLGTDEAVNAWARDDSIDISRPKHTIGINYKLIEVLYRDIENFCHFYSQFLTNENIDALLPNFTKEPLLFDCTSIEKNCFNMFVGALTFVFFHELGHLLQRHSSLRERFGNQIASIINECNIDKENKLVGKQAAISHITELYADSYGIFSCLSEIVRHFNDDKTELRVALYQFVCGLSCTFYIFSDGKNHQVTHKPVGSHPSALIRLEFALPKIYELMDLVNDFVKHEMTREDLVHICGRASIYSLIFQDAKREVGLRNDQAEQVKGLMNRKEDKPYLKSIFSAWEEISEPLRIGALYSSVLHEFSISDAFRDYLHAT